MFLYNVHGKTTQFIFDLHTFCVFLGAHFVKILRVGAQKNLVNRAIPVPDSLSHSYHCTFCLVLFLLKLSLFTNVNYYLVPKSGIYFRYRSNDMSSETQGDGGRGVGQQQLNGLINPYLIKQNLNKFSVVFVKQMVY